MDNINGKKWSLLLGFLEEINNTTIISIAIGEDFFLVSELIGSDGMRVKTGDSDKIAPCFNVRIQVVLNFHPILIGGVILK